MKASFFKAEANKIRCELCPHECLIGEGKTGLCHVRQNSSHNLLTLNYGFLTSMALDKIEKKPLYHFKPGGKILSLGTFGCNMKCTFCQNYQISQNKARYQKISVTDVLNYIDMIPDNIGIAFTYNEPFMWYEFIYDSVKQIKKQFPNKVIVLVTNGYINEAPLLKILPYIDAFNIDLKAFTNHFYKNICKASLEPVLHTIKLVNGKSHLEVTTLMITSENDELAEIENIALFISKLNKNIPLHLSRYFPSYKMKHQATDIKQMLRAKAEAEKHLNYVYLGNIASTDNNTYCPECHNLVYNRENDLDNTNQGKCMKCGLKIPIIF